MRPRLRDLGIVLGSLPPGPHNAITDVPGTMVGHATLIADQPRTARTGVTMVVPRAHEIWHDFAFAGFHVFNGNGEMTGLPWLEESGMLGSPIGITNTHQVGIVRDALVRHAVDEGHAKAFHLPVVAETYDGTLNDIDAFHVGTADALAALTGASGGPVAEGNVGGGTGMICHQFKGGIGTASRIAATAAGTFTVGALVQANYGVRAELRIAGVPVGRIFDGDHTPLPQGPGSPGDGSIIVVVATDAPLLPVQCRRLARRAAVGLARVGGIGHNGSGDLFLAFATGNRLPAATASPPRLTMVPHGQMDSLFAATAEAVEEAIVNALCAAEEMTGRNGVTVHALPTDELAAAMRAWRFGD